ncbi:hypothetical protein [Borrelia sp. RT1S]|uniref:hypothetical protein n=1 Tax=Borrelia sp. RT1S TaxID=2898580 RepID=UPI001E6039CA|nr:hypothetical protein [Borrelia sp. RT1S]UGQ17860.1 hypothetical protein LSO05_05360 [Borrelia sp. RT1S]
MIIIGKLKFYKINEIKNILEEIYDLPYSESNLYKAFTKIDAKIKIERTNYILEEFIKYLFVPQIDDPINLAVTRQKVKSVKNKILKKVNPSALRAEYRRIKKKIKLVNKEQIKQIREQKKEEIIKRINQNLCIVY